MMLRLLALLLLPLAAACATTAETAPAFASERISVATVGSGPDVVLIPGLGSHPDVWASTVAALPGYRYHLVHVAGFAGKPPGANASGPVVAPVAGEIARYIRETGLDRPALVGHSLGGSWAMMVAARHPELASGVMVVDMIPFMGTFLGPPEATTDSLRPMAEQMRQVFAANDDDARRTFIEQMIRTNVRDPSLRPRLVEQQLAGDRRVLGQAFYDIALTDLRPELANIRVPLTVLWVHPSPDGGLEGYLGRPMGPEQMEQALRLSYANAPRAVVKRIPDAWHFIMLDQPAAFQRELRGFLQAR